MECSEWRTVNPTVGRLSNDVDEVFNNHSKVDAYNPEVFNKLNEETYQCPNTWSEESFSFEKLIAHLKSHTWDGLSFKLIAIDDFQDRLQLIKKDDRYFEPAEDKVVLPEHWDSYNLICLVWLYLPNLDGYICYNCTRLGWRQHTEEFTKTVNIAKDEHYHPYGFMWCIYWRKYAMARLDRIPQTYDLILKYKVPKWHNSKWSRSDLHYQQMYQHERVWEEDLDPWFDPVTLELLPYFQESSNKIVLIQPSILTNFYTSSVQVEKEVDSNITLGIGFRVCLLRDTNQIFIVGGKGSEKSTFLYNPKTNSIENTKWSLQYPRTGHSLCSYNNTLVCTGSSYGSESGRYESGNKVEVFR